MAMELELRRVILFTPNLAAMTAFYRDILGLEIANREDGWVEFRAGGCCVALHAGKSEVGSRPPKLVFHATDVAATRAALVKRGLIAAGPVKSAARFDLCGCKDPDGNPFQISSR
jgi:catechol 2,3-dioxygenase-like lactoylglutathione lyase family enzyme